MSNFIVSSLVRSLRGLWSLLDGLRRMLLNAALLLLLAGLAWWLWQSRTPSLQPKTALVLDLAGTIVEQSSGTSLRGSALAQLRGAGTRQTRLRDVLGALDAAARDEQITHALLMLDDLGGAGPVTQREIAAALERFKASGKKVYTWGSSYGQSQYFLAAHASELWLHPMGMVFIEGYGRQRSYYKEAFDRLGVSANVVRVGQFKNAAETLAASGPSAQTLQSDAALWGSLWGSWTSAVERARRLPSGSVMRSIDELPASLQAAGGNAAQLALQLKLVDALKTREQMRALLIERGARDEARKTFQQVSLGEYVRRIKPARGDAAIAVVVAAGAIVDGRAAPGLVGGLSTAEQIRKAREDEQVKSLVLRVNSPGGSPLGSELVRRELELTRQAGKPVVVSMGDVAASGGYWIAMAADEIIADEATITGSIGVVGMLPSAQGALDKLGVRSAGAGTTWLVGASDLRRDPDPRFVKLVEASIANVYSDFIGLVARQRKSTPEKVEAAAQGRAWSGKDALAQGLVDRLGSYGDALKAAAARAKLPESAPVRYFESQPGRLQQLLRRFGLDAAIEAGLDRALAAGGAVGLLHSALAEEIAPDLEWLVEIAAQRRPFAALVHCLCTAP